LFYEDPHHTKLVDGRAYGYFGTTVAWSPDLDEAEVAFDLHRPYRIVKAAVAQPGKLEDRQGGPTLLHLDLGSASDRWDSSWPFVSDFRLSGSDYVKTPALGVDDPRHQRAWLSWVASPSGKKARWLRIRMQRLRPKSSISLGEVVIWGHVEGEIVAAARIGHKALRIENGRRYHVEVQQE
jgi:hypothetical protein